MQNYIQNQIKESINIKQHILSNNVILNLIQSITTEIIKAYKNGNKTILAGNGGSAADAQHISAEFVGKFYFDRPALSSIALTVNSSIITAIGNDYGYENIFSRQIQANGMEGDVFIGITTSGNSQSIIEAFKECKKRGIITVCFTGENANISSSICDYCIKIPSTDTPRIQESHILIGHIICALTEKTIFEESI